MKNTALIDQLQKELDEHKKIVQPHLEIIESITATIKALNSNYNNNSQTSVITHNDGYNIDWDYRGKIAFFIKKERRFLHNREIGDLVHEREPGITVDEFVKRFAGVLWRLKNENQLINVQINNSKRSTFWGVKEWLDEDGNIKPEHEINKKYLIGSKKKKLEIV